MSRKMSEVNRKRLSLYIAGYALSLILTLMAYILVTGDGLLPIRALALLLTWLALAQFTAQLLLFLRLDQESRPRWNLWVFGSMVGIVAILVGGSLWIMTNLNYHSVSPEKTGHNIIQDEGIER